MSRTTEEGYLILVLKRFFLISLVFGFVLASAVSSAQEVSGTTSSNTPSHRITQQFNVGQYTFPVELPEGFSLEVLAVGLESPRVLHFHGERLFVGSRSGNVYWLDPPYSDANVLVTLNDYPHSVVVHDNQLYVARTSGVYVAPFVDMPTSIAPSEFKLLVTLPGGRGHNSRTLKQSPEGDLFVSLGIAGNCSDQYLSMDYPFESRRGGVFKIDQDSNPVSLQPFASGLRNPVGFDWHPSTQRLYSINNGPDHQGYEYPREAFSELTENSFHGMPWYQVIDGKVSKDSCIDSEPPRPLKDVSLPVASFPARIAPMDMSFVGATANANYLAGDALVALHGSWATSNGRGDGNPASRREPAIVRVNFDSGEVQGVEDFLSGFQLANGSRWARPMGIAIGADGDIYFSSDDGIHGIYRIVYRAP